MKHLLTSLLFISISVMASDSKSVFYEPSKSNAYQGRLFYDANQEDYPIDKMMERCKGFTGVATAQTKSKKNQSSLVICQYKCSLHWSTKK